MTKAHPMVSDEPGSSSQLALLGLFPTFVQLDLVDDDAFRQRLGLTLDGTISLNSGEVKLARSTFFDGIRSLYGNAERKAEIEDEEGKCWTLGAEEHEGHAVIRLFAGDRHFQVHGFGGLHPDTAERLRQFELALSDAGLPPTALPEWREKIAARPLENEEVRHFDNALMHTPISNCRALDAELQGPSGNIHTIVPPHREYYERLCGLGDAASVEELASNVVPKLVADLLAWDVQKGARMALLLASHASIVPASGLTELGPEDLAELATWAIEKGDLISKVGMIELGLAALPLKPELAAAIQILVEQIRDLDASDPNGRLQLLMAAFAFASGEISRTKILADWPPFRRRFAALAQASLFERHAFGHLDVKHYCEWALEQRASRYYLQALVDLRVEPRWLPDYGVADQLGHELLGRIHNASGRYADNIPKGALRKLLIGKGRSGLIARLHFPGSFLPGPLEGAESGTVNPLPPEFDQMLDKSLSTERLEPKSVIALINLHGLFSVGGEKVERAVELIRDANHRFSADLDIETRNTLVSGLASVAGTMRNPALADELRIMMRKTRVDKLDPPPPRIELLTALTAAAAHKDLDAWLRFVGDWSIELALGVDDKEEANALLHELDTLCVIEPALRKSVGRGIAAVEAFLLM